MYGKIAITTTTFAEYDKKPLDILRLEGFEIIPNPHKRRLGAEELIEMCIDAIGIIAGMETLDSSVLKMLKSLKVISRCGGGMENIDMEAAKRHDIAVFNTPDAPTRAVSELTVGLLLNLLRKISEMNESVRRGEWRKRMGNLLYARTVGIIGFGRIGQMVARLLDGFECKVVYCDPFVRSGILGLERMTLESLLQNSDIVSIHASSKECIIGKKEFDLMKKGAFLLNLSRGNLIDEEVLYAALKDGRIAGAALDVFRKEPYSGELTTMDNVVLTPHIGSYAKEARIQMEIEAAQNIIRGLKGASST